MNKVYKVIWNATLGVWVAVSEVAKSKIKTHTAKVLLNPKGLRNPKTKNLLFFNIIRRSVLNTAVVTALFGFVPATWAAENCFTNTNNPTQTTDGIGNVSGDCTAGANAGITISANQDGNFPAGTNEGIVLRAKPSGVGTNGAYVSLFQGFANTTNQSTIRIGDSNATGGNSTFNVFTNKIAMGTSTTAANGNSSQAIGAGATVGTGATNGTAIGTTATVNNNATDAIAIGTNSTASSANSLAVGNTASATNTGTIALGNNANTGGSGTETLNNIAIGSNAKNGNVASGNPAGTGGQIALGSGATTTTFAQVAIGVGADAGGNNYSIAIGGGAKVTANSGVAVGGVAMGRNTQAGSFATAIGPGAQATATNSSALGNGATSGANNATALGNGANASVADSVALGSGSTTTAPTGTGYLTNSAAPTSVVSVGTASNLRRIQNLADGAADQDAVTIAQLKAQKVLTDKQGTDTAAALGGGSSYNATTGAVTAPSYNVGGTTVTGVNAALTNIDGRTTTNTTNISNLQNQTFKLQSNGDTATAVKSSDTVQFLNGSNVAITRSGNNITVGTQPQVNFDKVTVGNVVVDKTTNKITGVENGNVASNSKEVVNGGQLFTTNQNVTTAQNTANTATSKADTAQATADKGLNFSVNGGTADNVKLGETVNFADGTNTKAVYDAATNTYKYNIVDAPVFAGQVKANGFDANGQKIVNVADGTVAANSKDAVNGGQLFTTNQKVDQNTTNIGQNTTNISNLQNQTFKLQANGDTASAVKSSDTVQFLNGSNVAITRSGNNITVGTQPQVSFDKVTVGSVVVDKATNTINGLSNKTWNGTAVSGQAATEDQLAIVDGKLGNLDDAAVKYDDPTTKDKVTLGGAGSTTPVTLTNVKAGAVNSSSTDAINGSQLHGVADSVKNAIGGATTIDATTGAITTSNIGGTGSNTIDGAITSVKATADKGINFGGTTGKNNYALGSDINVKGDSNITSTTVAGGVQLGLGDTLNVKDAINVGSGTSKIKIDGTTNTINGLSNKTWNGTAVSGQAATEDQLQAVSDAQKATDDAAVKYDDPTTKDKVTLGGAGSTTPVTLTNVKAGAVNATSTDAINGSQLHGVADSVKNAIGGATTIDATTGAITTSNIGGTGSNTIDGAITSVKDAATKAKTTVTAGDNVVVTPTTNADGSSNYQVATAKDVNFDKVTVGSVVVDKATNTINGLSNKTWNGTAVSGQAATEDQLQAVSDAQKATDDAAVKYDNPLTKDKVTLGGAGSTTPVTLTNVKAGAVNSSSTDAINGSQLHGVADSVKNAIGGATTIDATTGAITTSNIGGTGSNTIDGAITSVKATTDKGINFGGTTGKNNYALGSDINVKGDSNITSTTVAGGVQLGLGDTLNVKDAINVGSGTSKIKIDGTTNTINGLSNKTWNGTAVSGQAATEDQLQAVSDAQKATDDAAVKYDDPTTKDKVTLGGAGSTTPVTLTNVKAGAVNSSSTDAINGSQLHGVADSVKNAIGGATTIDATTGAITTSNIGGTGSNTIDGAITSVKDAATKAKTTVTAGDNVVVTPTTNADGSSNYQVATAKDVNFDKVTVGSVVVDKATNTINGLSNKTWNGTAVSGQAATEDQLQAVSDAQKATDDAAVKYDNPTTKDKVTLGGAGSTTPVTLTNVKAGAVNSSSTDAINGSQLHGVADSVKNAIGGATTIDATTGAIMTSNIGGTGSNTIDGAISSVKDAATKAKTTVTAGDNVVVTPTTNADGSSNYQVATAKDVNFDKVTVGSVVVDKATNTINGLSNKTWNGTAVSGQAATEDQLAAVDSKLGNLDDAAVKYDDPTTKDKVTLGGAGSTTPVTLTNVKAGAVNSSSTDAINGSQLHGVADSVKNAIGGATTIDATTGAITTSNIGGTGSNTIDGAITSVKDAATKAKTTVTAGDNVVVTPTTNADGSSNYQVATAKDVNFDKVTVGSVVVDKATNTINGLSNKTWNGTAVSGQAATEDQLAAVDSKLGGLDDAAVKYDDPLTKDKVTLGGAGSTTPVTLTNVKAGAVNSSSTDAINGSQLHGVADSVKNAIGGATTIDATTGAITTSNIGGTGSNTIDGAITSVKATADKGIKFGNGTINNQFALGDTINVKGSSDGSITSTTTADGVQLGLGNIIKVGTTNPVTIDGTAGTIGGLSNKTWNGTAVSGQAATEDQLAIVDGKLGGLDDAAVKYDDPTTKDKVTLGGAGSTTPVTLTNVKAGVVNSSSTDAINGSQLHGVADSVKNAIGGSTTIDATTGAITTSNIGGTGSNTISPALKRQQTKASNLVMVQVATSLHWVIR